MIFHSRNLQASFNLFQSVLPENQFRRMIVTLIKNQLLESRTGLSFFADLFQKRSLIYDRLL